MSKLRKIWKEKSKILEGVVNSVFIRQEIEKVAITRQAICENNTCGYYDKEGSSENTFIKGSPGCGICGCNIRFMTHSMSSQCSLKDLGLTPLWKAELTQEEEDSLPIHD